jgi:hypothetical protein
MLLPSKLPAFSDCLEFVNMDYVFFLFSIWVSLSIVDCMQLTYIQGTGVYALLEYDSLQLCPLNWSNPWFRTRLWLPPRLFLLILGKEESKDLIDSHLLILEEFSSSLQHCELISFFSIVVEDSYTLI